ncbi:hypothetical protein B0H13DRAFT_1921730 [Mycena leptocephala]|nr:hypothetical protein B0H13DRAFT_1921730 [Mycena leptocephala]
MANPWSVDWDTAQLLRDVPPNSPHLLPGNIVKLPFMYPGQSLFADAGSGDAEILSLKSFKTKGGGSQSSARAKPRPVSSSVLKDKPSLTKKESTTAFACGSSLVHFGGNKNALKSVEALDTPHRNSRMGDFLYPTVRTSQEPLLTQEWRSFFRPRPRLLLRHSSTLYEPPNHTWVYGDVKSFVAPADAVKIQFAKTSPGEIHVNVEELIAFLHGVSANNPALDNSIAIGYLVEHQDGDGGGDGPGDGGDNGGGGNGGNGGNGGGNDGKGGGNGGGGKTEHGNGGGNNKGGNGGDPGEGSGVRVRKVVAGRPDNSMVAVVLECERRVRVGQAALVDPSAPRYTSLITFTLPPPDSSSERPSDTGSTFSLPLNQYPPREEDLDAAPAPEAVPSISEQVPSISEASVGTKPVDGSGSRWRRMRTLFRRRV